MNTFVNELAKVGPQAGVEVRAGRAHCQAMNCGAEFACPHLFVRKMHNPADKHSGVYPMHDKCDACRGIPEKPEPIVRERVLPDPEKAHQRWKEICKGFESYIDIEPNTLPEALREVYRTWTPQKQAKPGLIFLGGTGTHKSRTSFAIVERMFYAGRTVQIQSPRTFFDQCLGSFSDTDHARWKSKLINCDVLLFDDLTQSEWTARTGAVLYEVIEARCAMKRCIITSSNFRKMQLEERLPKNQGAQIRRRLNDMCTPIDTGNGTLQQLEF